MKTFQMPMLSMSLLGLCLLSGLDATPAHADFAFGKPVDLTTAIPGINIPPDAINCYSTDGLEVYIESDRPGGRGGMDIWVLRRDSVEADWGPLENLGPAINTAKNEGGPSISTDGLTLCFHSNRSGGYGSWDFYVTIRATKNDPWGQPVNLGSKVNGPSMDVYPYLTADGLELHFYSDRPKGSGGIDMYVSTRATVYDPWGDAVNLGSVVNSPYQDVGPCLSPDALLLFFASDRPDGYGGGGDIWMTRRASLSDPWGPPENLGPNVNGPDIDTGAIISRDGSTLYFTSNSGGTWHYCGAPIIPVVDFNGDGKIDAKDMALLVDNWGKNQPLCDIGPFPWGDGIVDVEDLKVLMKAIDGTDLTTNPLPHASEVPRDVVLSWTSVPFAQSYDVYFGTSSADVDNADRADPCGVLVSQGQVGTTYDPNGLLEYERTYYWRVDLVTSGAAPTIYKGPVLGFTTRPFSYPIKNVTATASSSLSSTIGPEKTIDGSGLNASDQHGTTDTTMWLSSVAGPQPTWIQYDFDKVYTLHQMWFWNSNTALEAVFGFGAKDVTVEYSTDPNIWTALPGVSQFARATGTADYIHNTTVDFGGVPVKYVKITITSNWGGILPQYGLSEVRFFYVPSGSPGKP